MMEISEDKIVLYNVCGNRLILIHLKSFSYYDKGFRHYLKDLGIDNGADSVMVLTGNPADREDQGFEVTMDVFEPRGNDSKNPHLPGSWSTLCGNGLRAVAHYLKTNSNDDKETFIIHTKSGLIYVDALPSGEFQANMGEFTVSQRNLSQYVLDFNFSEWIPKKVRGFTIKDIAVGMNGIKDSYGRINGEPHLVLFMDQHINIMDLKKLAEEISPGITINRRVFPDDINTNLAVVKKCEGSTLTVTACTFERGVNYVTESCGTGATAIGSYLLNSNPRIDTVRIQMLGGTVHVTRAENNGFMMRGIAEQIPLIEAEQTVIFSSA
jgi:diaminopimelate epimerase